MRNYGERMQQFLGSIDEMMALKDIVKPEFMEEIKDVKSMLGSFDMEDAKEVSAAATVLSAYSTEIQTVQNGLPEIRRVAEMKGQIQDISDARQNIGLVAGNIKSINEVAEDIVYIRAASAMKPMIDETLALSVKMDAVLDMEEDIRLFLKTADRVELVLEEMNQARIDIKNAAQLSVAMVKKINVAERRIDNKIDTIENMVNQMETFKVRVTHLNEHSDPTSSYSQEYNILELGIPRGKTGAKGNYKGEKGEDGNNGTNFQPSYMGNKTEMARYGNFPVGTSFLSLDEIPTMIYFRKSNALDDWTKGQPFGVSNGGYSDDGKGIDIVNGINIDELTTHILQNIERRENG